MTMPAIGVALVSLVFLVAVFSAVWAWQLRTENAGMVDPVWAGSLGAVALLDAGLGTGAPSCRALVALGGAAMLTWFIRKQLSAARPMVDMRLFTHRIILSGVMMAMLAWGLQEARG